MQIPAGKKIYFISDFHLGVPDHERSLEREKKIVRWLNQISSDAAIIYLMGDVFDYWFEYKHAVPKGYVRLLGKLAELSDSGIEIHYFTGNHDMWVFTYFEEELGMTIHHEPIELSVDGKLLLIGHGDGLGPRDKGYKMLKLFFRSKLCQFLFGWIHPNIGIGLANFWSRRSRIANRGKDEKNYGDDEWLLIYSKEKLMQKHYDYFVFGHRHLPLNIQLNEKSQYINLGDWIVYFSYAVFENNELSLKYYKQDK